MEIKLAPGEFMIREKTKCEALFIVKEGQLEVFKTSPTGEKILIGMISRFTCELKIIDENKKGINE